MMFASITYAEDRAQVMDMRSKLLLPDGSHLHVEVFSQCTDADRKVGALLFSDSAVETYALALDIQYGNGLGDYLKSIWNKKKNADDPRLPTYIVVYNAKEKNNNQKRKELQKDTEFKDADEAPFKDEDVFFIANCGGTIHDPLDGQ